MCGGMEELNVCACIQLYRASTGSKRRTRNNSPLGCRVHSREIWQAEIFTMEKVGNLVVHPKVGCTEIGRDNFPDSTLKYSRVTATTSPRRWITIVIVGAGGPCCT